MVASRGEEQNPDEGSRSRWVVPAGDSRVIVEKRDGILVLRPDAVLDAAVVDRLGEIASTATEPMIVDLDECTLDDPSTLWRLAPARWGRVPGDISIACDPCSAPPLLSRMEAAGVAVFQSVADALRVRESADQGVPDGLEAALGDEPLGSDGDPEDP